MKLSTIKNGKISQLLFILLLRRQSLPEPLNPSPLHLLLLLAGVNGMAHAARFNRLFFDCAGDIEDSIAG